VKLIKTYLQEMTDILQKMPVEAIDKAVDILNEARERGKTIYLIGNGGSGATASHFANDIVKNTMQAGRPSVKCVALTDNMPIIMAIANDMDYSLIFVEQLKPLAQPGDVLIGFSGSGNSPNVVKAMAWAKEHDLTVIALGGRDGGKMKAIADVNIIAPTDSMAQLEDVHLIVTHMLYLSMMGETRSLLM
jgi:D-sedoheptulose 7-phosphate isomerase